MIHEIEQALAVAAVVAALIALRVLFLYFKPYRPCRWCRPGGVLGGSWVGRVVGDGHARQRRRKRLRCWRCKGKKLTRRWGAWHVHKARLSLAQAWDERGTD